MKTCKSGLHTYDSALRKCPGCAVAASSKWQKKWRKTNPEDAKARDRKVNLSTKYGITLEKYEQMFSEQQGKCAICAGSNKRRLAVDHDHATGKVRGLLCDRCNRVYGLIEESKDVLEGMIKYHDKWK